MNEDRFEMEEDIMRGGMIIEDDTVEAREHPLLNSDSSHYSLFDDEAIEQFEKMFTTEELMAWSKLNYYKYMFRLGKKDGLDKEVKKMRTYEDYYNYLKEK